MGNDFGNWDLEFDVMECGAPITTRLLEEIFGSRLPTADELDAIGCYYLEDPPLPAILDAID